MKQIIERSGLTAAEVCAMLIEMELSRLVRSSPSSYINNPVNLGKLLYLNNQSAYRRL